MEYPFTTYNASYIIPVCILDLIIVPLVSLMTKAQPKNEIEKIFSCYNRTVTVKAKDSIETEE